MNILGMTWEAIFALVLLAVGPVAVTMNYMPIAHALSPEMRRKLAWRTILIGFIIMALLILLGDGVVRRFHLSEAVLLIGVGVSNVVLAVPMLLAGPGNLSTPTTINEPLRFAISPLAVPALVSPLAVALLLGVSAFARNLTDILTLLGMIVAVLIVDLVLMLLSTSITRYLTQPILEVLQKIFGFIQLTFGIQLLLLALTKWGIAPPTGF